MPDGFDLLAIIGATTGCLSLGIQAWEAFRDRSKIVCDVDFGDADVLKVTFTNVGRQPISIRSFGYLLDYSRIQGFQLSRRERFKHRLGLPGRLSRGTAVRIADGRSVLPIGESIAVDLSRRSHLAMLEHYWKQDVRISGYYVVRSDGKHLNFPKTDHEMGYLVFRPPKAAA